mmetsp:Transcript_7306/g.17811  ORF Transcript_7306/g.17811 Transcript_7306/m.17811 type:complete len:288 (+) Transcript_7306:3347-4210(+)
MDRLQSLGQGDHGHLLAHPEPLKLPLSCGELSPPAINEEHVWKDVVTAASARAPFSAVAVTATVTAETCADGLGDRCTVVRVPWADAWCSHVPRHVLLGERSAVHNHAHGRYCAVSVGVADINRLNPPGKGAFGYVRGCGRKNGRKLREPLRPLNTGRQPFPDTCEASKDTLVPFRRDLEAGQPAQRIGVLLIDSAGFGAVVLGVADFASAHVSGLHFPQDRSRESLHLLPRAPDLLQDEGVNNLEQIGRCGPAKGPDPLDAIVAAAAAILSPKTPARRSEPTTIAT